MYRTKIFNILDKDFLKPILDFLGLGIIEDNENNLIKWIGSDQRTEDGKIVPTYLRNQFNEDKIYTIIRTQDEFIKYKTRKEELEFFNPFVRYKNALTLLLMTTPVIYDRYCIHDDSSIVDHIYNECKTTEELAEIAASDVEKVASIVDDELYISQEEILKHVKIKQYPLSKDQFETPWYKFSVEIKTDDNRIEELISVSSVKLVSVLMLIYKIMGLFEEAPIILTSQFNGSFDDMQQYLEELLEKYMKERELNRKDLKKVKIETELDIDADIDNADLYEDVESLLNSSQNEEKENKDSNGVIDITDTYKDVIPILPKEDDDDMMNLELW